MDQDCAIELQKLLNSQIREKNALQFQISNLETQMTETAKRINACKTQKSSGGKRNTKHIKKSTMRVISDGRRRVNRTRSRRNYRR